MSNRRVTLFVLMFLAEIILSGGRGRAQVANSGLPTEPILRIETGKHRATINRIDTDAANRYAVTASDDRTARVWSLPDGRLLRIFRLPVGEGNIGQAYAVAISPDGATVAVGGFTGPPGHQNIFLFDRASGELKRRLPDFPNVIHHLAYSADGKRLAASLHGANGVRVFDAGNGYRPMPSDSQYRRSSYWAAFDLSGRLVTTSEDGSVRLYASDHYDTPIARFDTPGRDPFEASFSPDGTRVAVGYDDKPDVVVLSGADLRELFRPSVPARPSVPGPDDSLGAVGWSVDGRFLFAGGLWSVDEVNPVRQWSDGGRGAFVDIPSATDTVMQILGLKDGHMLFASQHNFGVIETGGKAVQLQGYGALALNSQDLGSLLLSKNGDSVQVDSWDPLHTYRFALSRRQVDVDPKPDASLLAPTTHTPGLSVVEWQDSAAPIVKGIPLLSPSEKSRSAAIVPGNDDFVLGTDWSLRMFDRNGLAVWPARPLPDTAWYLNVTADRRLIVAALGDGTIRWYRVSDGQEVLALFIHPDGQRWILWTAQGYYDASTGADDLIGWQVNHGYDRAPDFYPVSQFRDRYYRPDVIRQVLTTPSLDVAEAVREADDAAGRPLPRAAPIGSLLTPVVEIHGLRDPAREDRTDLDLSYLVRLPAGDDTLRVEARIDGVTAPADDDRLVDKGDARAGSLHLVIPRRNSTLSVIAYNRNGASVPALAHVLWTGAGTEPKLTLYVLAVGISNYSAVAKDPKLRLKFAAKDAADFVAVAEAQQGGLYEKVIPYPQHESLTDKDATRDAILDGLDWIMRAVTNTNDVAMVFLSGHGMNTPDQHYRLLPYDYDPDRVERTTISDVELQDYLTKIGGKKIFFFDTCYSGNILEGARGTGSQPNVDKFANDLKAAPNGIVVFASSTGDQLSLERDEWHNGAFTKALVAGMRGAAARQGVAAISISDLEGYVSRTVKELTDGNQRPVVAMPRTVDDYWIAERLN
jgi:WD40 repeat protein